MVAVKAAVRGVVLALLVILFFQPLLAWWDNGHILVNRAAALAVPADMPAFLRQAADRVAYLGPEPDRWRQVSEFALKNSQEPDHFIDLERVADVAELPAGRYDYYRLLYAKRIAAKEHGEDFLPEKVGLQPYITMEIYGRLKVAFREYRRLKEQNLATEGVEQNIVLYAGWLGHYVADGANPHHTTIHHHGWLGDNPNGYTTNPEFHSEFEGRFVTRAEAHLQIAGLRPPTQLGNPFRAYMEYLRASNKLVEKTYQLEKAGAFKDTGTEEGREFVRERLTAGAQMLLNLWYTAWQESAAPVAHPPRPNGNATRTETSK